MISPTPPSSDPEHSSRADEASARRGIRLAGYRRGEPLVASWDPVPETEEAIAATNSGLRPEKGGKRGLLSRYGWGLYAVPLLVVVSTLAVFQAADRPSGTHASVVGQALTDASDTPIMREAAPSVSQQPERFSADLPDGGPIPESGARTFAVLPGTSPRVGTGRLYRYTVEVEVGVELADGNDSFARLVQETLSDPRSWTNPAAGGIALQRVDKSGPSPDFRVILVSQQTARQACDYSNGVPFDSSCRKGPMVYINAARWVRGAVVFNGDNRLYRQYAINHEVGHVFGNGHVGCPAQGALAPVMMQQTFSVSDNVLHDLNRIADQGTNIPADGLVCRPNAWPVPAVNSAG